MTPNEYLTQLLKEQTLYKNMTSEDCPELASLRAEKERVVQKLLAKFGNGAFKLYNGGSYIKNTMVKASYDFDLPCYFYQNSTAGGNTLHDIYHNVANIFDQDPEYTVTLKNSAIALKRFVQEQHTFKYTHIDLVPGRFTSEDPAHDTDANLYQKHSGKNWLKTNTGVQIRFIRDSGLTSLIRLLKLWRHHLGLNLELKTFILELMAIKICTSYANSSDYAGALQHFWTVCADAELLTHIKVTDPANPQGNDLSDAADEMKELLTPLSAEALRKAQANNWAGNFSSLIRLQADSMPAILTRQRETFAQPAKPWC